MADAPARDPAPPHGGRIRLRTLVFIRWIAVLGQLAALLVVHAGLGFTVPLVPAAAAIGGLAALNLAATIRHKGMIWLDDRRTALYLGADLVQIAILLGLTGGLANPFAIMLLAPVVVSAATLSLRSTAALAGLAVLEITLLAIWRLPLPWGADGLDLPPLYSFGIWGALVTSVIFSAAYVSSIALESRRMGDALAATQLALAREQRVSELGALAAAAAHELGTPLGTIFLVARELERELPADLPRDSQLREDIALLRSESERCRQILAELASRPGDDEDSPFHRLPLASLVEVAAAPFRREPLELRISSHPSTGTTEEQPVVARSPELLHGLGTLLQNALQFARNRVDVDLYWDEREIAVEIRDDGPGFTDFVLGEIGDPYVSTGGHDLRGDESHMGLGIFIARTLLARSGAEVAFANHRDGGAQVVIRWPRDQLEIARA